MRWRSPAARLLAALAVCIPLGCSSRPPVLKKNPPPDPLLMSKTPVQAKYGTSIDAQSRPEPAAPTMPAGAWAVSPAPAVPAARLGNPGEPGPFRWTSEKRTAKPASLEGVLEGSADKGWCLRCQAGKVRLEGHPQLDLFEAGYVLQVEGQLLESSQPRCRVQTVRVLNRGGSPTRNLE